MTPFFDPSYLENCKMHNKSDGINLTGIFLSTSVEKNHIQIRFTINEVIILRHWFLFDSFYFHLTNHMSDLFEKAWEGNFMKNQRKLKLDIKLKFNFCVLVYFWPPHILKIAKAEKNILLYFIKKNYMTNIKKKKIIKLGWKMLYMQKTDNTIFGTWGTSCFCGWYLIRRKDINVLENEHSYQAWFPSFHWFWRKRLKCKSLQTTDAKWWQ